MKSRWCLFSYLTIVLVFPAATRAQLWSGLIDSNRAVDWSQAGIPGGLPDANWPVCTTISAYSGDASNINNALSSCASAHSTGGVVVLGPGTFTLSSSISFPKGHLVLRGQGANSTHLLFTGAGSSSHVYIHGDSSKYRGAAWNGINVTGGLSQGSTTLTLASTSGITANTSALIMTQCDTGYSGSACTTGSAVDNGGYFECAAPWSSTGVGCAVPSEGPNGANWRPNGHSWQMEMFLVTAVSGSNVTIDRPLHHPNWSTGQSAQVVAFSPVQQDGVENLWVDNSGDNGTNGVGIYYGYQCWVSGVASTNALGQDIVLYQSINSVVQNSYVYGTRNTAGDNSGLWAANGSFNVLQNNICQGTGSCLFNDGPEEGDVVAYNYAAGLSSGAVSNGQMNSGSATHSAGDNWMLFEGNIWTRSNDDLDHGDHLSQTYFRNFFTGWDSWVNGNHGSYTKISFGTWTYSNGFGSRYGNLIANVLGTPGVHTTYANIGASTNQFGSAYIFVPGAGNQSTSTHQPSDPLAWCQAAGGVSNFTNMCWANWDVVHGATQFNTAEVPTNANSYPNSVPSSCTASTSCAASLYLSGKPGWWPSSTPFPPIGYDVSGGDVGQCSGTLGTTSQAGLPATSGTQCGSGKLNAAWGQHVNANPAMACYLVLGGLPDGSGPALSFNGSECYGSSSSTTPTPPPSSSAPNPPANLVVTVN